MGKMTDRALSLDLPLLASQELENLISLLKALDNEGNELKVRKFLDKIGDETLRELIVEEFRNSKEEYTKILIGLLEYLNYTGQLSAFKKLIKKANSGTKYCPIHQLFLQIGFAAIFYGKLDKEYISEREKASEIAFPYSFEWIWAGTCRKNFGLERIKVLFCQKCREAELDWEYENQ
jgi:hypothetical protein